MGKSHRIKLFYLPKILMIFLFLFVICGANSPLYSQTEKDKEGVLSKKKDEVTKLRKASKRLNRDIKKKSSQIENLTKKLTRLTGELSQLKRREQILSADKQHLTASLGKREKELARLSDKYDRAAKGTDLTQKKFTQLMEEYSQLQKSVKDKDIAIKDLNKKITALIHQQKNLARPKGGSEDSLESSKETESLRKEIAQLKRAADVLKAEISKKNLQKEKEMPLSPEDRSLLSKTIKEKDSTIADLGEKLNLFLALEKTQEKDEKVGLLLVNIRKLSKEKKKIESEFRVALEKNKKLARIIEEKELGITGRKEALLKKFGASATRAKFNLNVEIRGLKKENNELRAQNRNLKDEISIISEKYQAKLEQGERLKNEITFAKLKTEELKRQIGSKQKVINATEGITKDLRYKVQGLERQKRKLVLEKEDIKEEVDREKLKMHYNLALYYDSRSLYKEAEKEYINALSIDHDDPEVHYNLGILYDDALNEDKKAIYHYRRYLQLRPKVKGFNKVKAWIIRAESDERLRRLAPETMR